MKTPFIDISPARRFSVYGRFTIFHSHKDGSPVLKDHGSIWNISGFMIQTKKYRISINFRRRKFLEG